MPSLTILSAPDLHSLLLALTHDDITSMQRNIAEALREYSTGTPDQGCSAAYQPRRTAITRRNGCTTLFMPATTGETLGIRMVSLQDNDVAGSSIESGPAYISRLRRESSIADADRPSSSDHRTSVTSSSSAQSDDASSSGEATMDDSTTRKSSMPQGTVNDQGVTRLSETMGAWPGIGTRDTSPQGSVTLLNSEGLPFGLINALELTAFRTALAAMLLFNKREKVKTLSVFGAGRQAYWHIRLALTLRGSDIKRVYIFNRSFDRAASLLRDIYSPSNSSWRGDVKFTAMSTDFIEYQRILNAAIHRSDAIFCCTPSTEPLFPAKLLTSKEGRRKGRFLCAVGSYKAHMTELDPEILRDEVTVQPIYRHHLHRHTAPSGVIVVDSLGAALKEAGEITQAEITPLQMVELGELMMVRDVTAQEPVDDGDQEREKEQANLRRWIQKGNVIYKSVGLGLMDLVTGGDLVEMAKQRGLGTLVENF